MRSAASANGDSDAHRSGSKDADGSSQWTYRPLAVIGRGSFGIVALAEVVETGERVAIKRVVFDPHRTSRELLLLQKIRQSTVVNGTALAHPGLVQLRTHYYTTDPSTGGRSLNMVMNYLPINLLELQRVLQRERPWRKSLSPDKTGSVSDGRGRLHSAHEGAARPADSFHDPTALCSDFDDDDVGDAYGSHRHGLCVAPFADYPPQRLHLLLVKVILFQLARGLAWLHHLHITHRDVKPGNVLFDPETLQVQLCDLGSAKEIVNKRDERNVFYICSRYYRAPELLFGALHYGSEVDMWSLGCIAAELVRDLGKPLFRGSTTADQMCEIFKVLGSPSQAEMEEMSSQGAKAMALSYQQSRADPFSHLSEPFDSNSTARTATQPSDSSTRTSSSATAPVHSAHPSTTAPSSRAGYDVMRIRPMQWPALFPPGTPHTAVDLVSQLLVYSPSSRLTAAQVVEHAFFDELFTLDWTTLRLLQGALPHIGGEVGGPGDIHDASYCVGDVASAWQKSRDTKLISALFGLAPGEGELYSDSFCARLTVKYKQLEDVLTRI